MTEEMTDVGRGITICHESFGDEDDPSLLLVMGLGTQMVAWNDDFCSEVAARGFHVIRFDNRDVGRSTRTGATPVTAAQILRRRAPANAYSLEDMADDSTFLARELGLGPVHVVGASMGGMIGQVMTARHPADVRSLVSIMSNTGSRWNGQPAMRAMKTLMVAAPEEKEAFVEHVVGVFTVVGSRGLEADMDHLRWVAERSFERGQDAEGVGRQLGAIIKTGDRKAMLRSISAPTLVIHGTDDVLVRPSGGRATAKQIPDARLLEIDGMGHDLPRAAWGRIIDGIAETAERAASVLGRPTSVVS